MLYYGYEGENIQAIVNTASQQPPADLIIYDNNGTRITSKPAILMHYERPSNNHIANADGTWQMSNDLLIQEAEQKKNSLLELARNKINDLQIIIDMQTHNPEDDDTSEKQLLTAWKQYLVDLYEIEQQQGFPETINWPTPPVQTTT